MTGRFEPPHLEPGPVVTSKRGFFFLPGDLVETASGTAQSGSVFVEWEVRPESTRPYPVVLVHGGGGQSTDFKGTPDGRPGWFQHLVDDGFAVYCIDRPGHGRSPQHPDVLGPTGPQLSYEFAQQLFVRGESTHTQWVGEPVPGDAVFDQFVASVGALMSDLAVAQDLDGERVAQLLDLIGPAVLVTHSAGAPAGWLAAAKRPGLVKGIVAVEPMGPPFAELPGLGEIEWGLTYAPLAPGSGLRSAEFREAAPQLSSFEGVPVVVVVGSASQFAEWSAATVEFLRDLGADATELNLGDHGHVGNGHGLIFERNSAVNVRPVIDWIGRLP